MRFATWIFIGFVLPVFCSCALTERGMMNHHTYYSTDNPNLRIDVSENFSLDETSKGANRYEFKNKEDRRFVLIKFIPGLTNETNVDYYNHPLKWIFFNIPNCVEIDQGQIDILGKTWYFRDSVYHPSTASCSLIRDIGFFTDRHDTFKVLYFQELPPYQCRIWKEVYRLNGDQQNTYNRFLHNMALDVKMSGYTPEPASP